MPKDKLTKCKGKIEFCWPWEEFSNGSSYTSKGIGFQTTINIKTGKRDRSIPVLKHGAGKKDVVALNYCPFCGADYEKLERI